MSVDAAVKRLRELSAVQPRVLLVLGSGLGALADDMDDAQSLPFRDVPGFAPSEVEGHKGRVVIGRLEGVPCIALQGRYHLYEGHSPESVALPVRVAAALGVELMVVTNAAGGLNRSYRPGDFMIIDDHINLMWRNPLMGPVQPGEQRFPDLSEPYDRALQHLAERVAVRLGLRVVRGTYLAVLGPSYETPAEIRMYQHFGGDAVGMSTVPEVLTARALGLRVLGISLISNPAAGMTGAPLTHDEVIEAGKQASAGFGRLVRSVLAELFHQE